jgi:dTMP kinase
MIEEFDKMAEEFGFEVVDARKPPEEIQEGLRAHIQPLLERTSKKVELVSADKTSPVQ